MVLAGKKLDHKRTNLAMEFGALNSIEHRKIQTTEQFLVKARLEIKMGAQGVVNFKMGLHGHHVVRNLCLALGLYGRGNCAA
ncbi:hypothetical protein [Roseovarius azorensis]|uniref:hypothetical protein n=1 Tax=Roseovarius azorensis TaxID=1287727 RepID=UPI001FE7D7AE|nr:hypothetical protein [Roseovarius azorensis]